MMQKNHSARFFGYLAKYSFVINFIADLHLNGSPLIVHGKEVETYEFFRMLIEPLKRSSMIVFLGDTLERNLKKNFSKAKKQFHILCRVLDEYQLLEKTVIILGNHDPRARYFLWLKPITVRPYIRMSIYPYRDVIIHHGDNLGTDPLMKKTTLVDEDIQFWRTGLKRKVDGQWIRKEDVVIIGHIHRGYCNRKENTLAVPSIKKILKSSSKKHLGYIGMFFFSSKDDLWDWNIAIESPCF